VEACRVVRRLFRKCGSLDVSMACYRDSFTFVLNTQGRSLRSVHKQVLWPPPPRIIILVPPLRHIPIYIYRALKMYKPGRPPHGLCDQYRLLHVSSSDLVTAAQVGHTRATLQQQYAATCSRCCQLNTVLIS
jgi:hypothetical protein